MIDNEKVLEMFKNGMSRSEIARFFKVQNYVIEVSLKGYPRSNFMKKIKDNPGFEEWFIKTYNESDTTKDFVEKCLKHDFFKRVSKKSIFQRISELRKLFNLQCKMPEERYSNRYDKIKGYIIRNSKFTAKRRGIPFSITKDDFELPKRCPILGFQLEYGVGNDGNSTKHATLDRIDNTKGYIPGNIMIISRLANAMKNQATFDQLQKFINNYSLLLNYKKEHGALGSITDMFPHWEKLHLDS